MTIGRETVIYREVTRLHQRIRKLRIRAGLTQAQLAVACRVHKTAVSHWETGDSAPRANSLTRVARALGVSVSELYGEAA